MKLEKRKIKTEEHGVLSEAKFGISEFDQVHILTILRDKLYSNKIRAFVREYSTNATDAHVYADCPERPIKVTLPGRFDPKFSVRDFGDGLSETDIFEIYVRYGASTKRDSNDAIGQLGLGCKSAFAYTDAFTINSWHEGIHSIYSAFIDETNVGKVTKLSAIPSAEPSGVRIDIPVAMKDVDTVKKEAEHCYRFFTVRPEVNIPITVEKVISSGNGWKLLQYVNGTGSYQWRNGKNVFVSAEPAYAVMGDIGYPIDTGQITGSSEMVETLIKSPVLIEFGIGDLSIAANRETLEYTSHTIGNIKKRLAQVGEELRASLVNELEGCKTSWDARIKAHQISTLGLTGNTSLIKTLLHSSPKWKHITGLTEQQVHITGYNQKDLVPRLLRNDRTTTSIDNYQGKYLAVEDSSVVFYVDTKNAWLQRALLLRDDIKKKKNLSTLNAIIIKGEGRTITSEADLKTYLKAKNIDGIPVYKLSEVDYTRVAATGNASTPQSVKTSVLVQNTQGWSDTRQSRWDPAVTDLANGKGVYAIVDRFRAIDYKNGEDGYIIRASWSTGYSVVDSEKEGLWDKAKRLRAFTAHKDLVIYGFKPRIRDKIGSGWVEFKDFYKVEFLKAIQSDPIFFDDLCLMRTMQLLQRHVHSGKIPTLPLPSDIKDQTSLIVEFLELAKKVTAFQATTWKDDIQKKKLEDVNNELRNIYGEDNPIVGVKSDDLVEKIYKAYPMLRYTGLSFQDERRKDMIAYIDKIDGDK